MVRLSLTILSLDRRTTLSLGRRVAVERSGQKLRQSPPEDGSVQSPVAETDQPRAEIERIEPALSGRKQIITPILPYSNPPVAWEVDFLAWDARLALDFDCCVERKISLRPLGRDPEGFLFY
jgi:hypothetical protein